MNDVNIDIDVDLNYFNEIYPDLNNESQSKYYDVDSFRLEFRKSPKNFAVFHLNVRSLCNKLDKLNTLLDLLGYKFDIICLTETWLTSFTCEMFNFDGYKSFNLTRNLRRGGGVSVFVDQKYRCKLLENFSRCSADVECIFVECSFKNKKVITGCIYRPPSGDINTFLVSVENILGDLYNSYSGTDFFICGDFNVNLLEYDSDNLCGSFMNLMSSNSLLSLITKPTRINDVTGNHSLLDNIFCKNPVMYNSGILVSDLSDHYPVFSVHGGIFDVNNDVCAENYVIRYRAIGDRTLNEMCSALTSYDFSHVYDLNDVNDAFVVFESILMNLYNNACPIVSRNVSYKEFSKPWIGVAIKSEMRKRDKYLLLYRSGRMGRVEFNRLRNRVTTMIRDSKKSYFVNKFEQVRYDMRRTWNLINSTIKPKYKEKGGHITRVRVDGDIVDDPYLIANSINDYFSTIGEKIANSVPPSNVSYHEFLRGNYVGSFFFPEVTIGDVILYVKSLKNKKCSINCIPAFVLKRIVPIIAPVMCYLINFSIGVSVFPACLKVARVVPLFKGGDSADMSNYRPISVLNILSKIIEKHAFRNLYSYFEKNNILSESQFGFRYGRGTSQAILKHCSYIYEKLDDNDIVFAMYLDFKKAFDSVDHEILLRKLSFYGVRGIPNQWLKSYLTDREQYVNINGVCSLSRTLYHSVPQGSNLGPLLFLIYINDLPNSSDSFSYTMFADDCTIACNIDRNHLNIAHQTINDNLLPIVEWITANRLKINVEKTKYILYSYRGQNSLRQPIKIGHEIVEQTDCVKFLGIKIDEKLTFSHHVSHISNKISSCLGMLCRLREFVPLSILGSVYNAIVLPHICYGIECWYGAPEYIKGEIRVLQKRSVRVMNFLSYNDHTNVYFHGMKLLPVDCIYSLSVASYVYRTINAENFDNVLKAKLRTHQDQHSYPTRSRQDYLTPRFNRVKSDSHIHYAGVKLWNEIPNNIKTCPSVLSFKRNLKNHFLESLI